MRVLLLDAPQAMLDERRALGLDGRDEMWDGVLHVIPPPSGAHQGLSSEFFLVVAPPVTPDGTGELASEVLAIRLATVETALRITWPDGSAAV